MGNERSKKQEQQIAKELNGKTQPASGAFDFWKYDVETMNWLIDAKYTDKKSFSVNKEKLADLKKEAFLTGVLPAIVIEFSPKEKYAVIRYEEFLALEEYMKEDLEQT